MNSEWELTSLLPQPYCTMLYHNQSNDLAFQLKKLTFFTLHQQINFHHINDVIILSPPPGQSPNHRTYPITPKKKVRQHWATNHFKNHPLTTHPPIRCLAQSFSIITATVLICECTLPANPISSNLIVPMLCLEPFGIQLCIPKCSSLVQILAGEAEAEQLDYSRT